MVWKNKEAERIYKRKYRKLYPEKCREQVRNCYAKHCDKYKLITKNNQVKNRIETNARQLANDKLGKAKYGFCPLCMNKNVLLDKHHPDYTKPLEVIYLCKSCHRRLHLGKDAMELKAKLSRFYILHKLV